MKKQKISIKKIIAAGGLVQNQQGKYLFIFRKGKWDLPKGKVDPGESIKDAALREVKEECGIRQVQIAHPIAVTYHTYELNGEKVEKETHWFMMNTGWKGKLIPQEEEDITQVKWAGKKEMMRLLENTYHTIREVIHAAFINDTK